MSQQATKFAKVIRTAVEKTVKENPEAFKAYFRSEKVDHGRAQGRAEKRKFIGSGEDGHLYDHY